MFILGEELHILHIWWFLFYQSLSKTQGIEVGVTRMIETILENRLQRYGLCARTHGGALIGDQLGPGCTTSPGPDGKAGDTLLAKIFCPRSRWHQGVCPGGASKCPPWHGQPGNRRRDLLGQRHVGEQKKMAPKGEEPRYSCRQKTPRFEGLKEFSEKSWGI